MPRIEAVHQGLDVGIVLVIALNAIVIGVGVDDPHHMMTYEILEVVTWTERASHLVSYEL